MRKIPHFIRNITARRGPTTTRSCFEKKESKTGEKPKRNDKRPLLRTQRRIQTQSRSKHQHMISKMHIAVSRERVLSLSLSVGVSAKNSCAIHSQISRQDIFVHAGAAVWLGARVERARRLALRVLLLSDTLSCDFRKALKQSTVDIARSQNTFARSRDRKWNFSSFLFFSSLKNRRASFEASETDGRLGHSRTPSNAKFQLHEIRVKSSPTRRKIIFCNKKPA